MTRVFFYSPHPDDETLSMGLAMLHYIANACEVHLVSITNGSALGVANTLNGSTDTGTPVACTISDHPYIHSPAREGYPLVDPASRITVDDIGAARNAEARSALAAMAMVPPVTPGVTAPVYHHTENLPGDFAGTGSSSTSPVTPEGIAAAKTIIKRYVDEYPNSFHFTMSQTDDHHDHAACGFALRELKDDDTNKVPWADITYHDALVNARFFVSRLYYANNYANGADVKTMPGLAWFTYSGANYDRYCAWLRDQVQKAYHHWNPAQGAYGVGYHQVAAQFNSNFGTGVSIGNLWHA